MLTYPGARWKPLGAQTETRMTGHDIVCLHTMVGYLISTDRYFRISNGEGYRGTESHYGVGGKWGPDLGAGLDGAVWQWQDRGYTADANLDGKLRVISVETADNAPDRAADIEAWTPLQVEALARLIAWESTKAAHAECPATWTCHKSGIPLVLIPDTLPGRRGIGYHQQGIDPVRVAGGVRWSNSYGKECPARRRIAQIPGIITRARQLTTIVPDPTPSEPTVTPEQMKAIAEQISLNTLWLHYRLLDDLRDVADQTEAPERTLLDTKVAA